ncbi:MAG: adaptor protein MecA [Lachnospiraceae bacterium]|nr:adaptor protein MecA [Lachnospiraceae bacterium]
MKIEKINDSQIRCTLTSDDLASRKIKLSELAYGTEKAKILFQDMMQQAHYEFGFESDNSPLMIEAIPVASDSIVLIITKVENPEELDTRFSKFSPFDDESGTTKETQFSGADDLVDLFHKIYEAKNKLQNSSIRKDTKKSSNQKATQDTEKITVNLVQTFRFCSLDDAILAAHSLNHFYSGKNSLYKNKKLGSYQLVVHQSNCTPEAFNKVCNILSEYGTNETFSVAGEAYLLEHGNVLIKDTALQNLANV